MTAAMCLALAIYFEAGTEPTDGMVAVGWAVINSSKLHKKPFSICREIFGGRYIGVNNGYKQAEPPKGRLWKISQAVATQILAGHIPDITGGATNFECTRWKSCVSSPWWSKGMAFQGYFGSQKFWKRIH